MMNEQTLACEMCERLYAIVRLIEFQIKTYYGRDIPKALAQALSEARDAMAMFEHIEDQRAAELDAAEVRT